MRKQILFLISTFILIVINNQAFGVIAYPFPVEIIQPDGTKITIIQKGDEHLKWAQTLDGYSIMRNSKGIYEYSTLSTDKEMIPSGIVAKNESDRNPIEIQFLKKTTKGLVYSKSQVGMMKSISSFYQKSSQKAFPTSGSRKLVCILMGFTDKAFTKTKADFEALFNQVGYAADGAEGSVFDYYKENSFNQLDLKVTVAGPYIAAHNMAYYGANDESGDDVKPDALVTEAVRLANSSVNYADFDNDNDGSVDGVYVIYAGYGEETGVSPDAIWAHAWNINPVTLDGKSVSRYSCSAELRGNNGSGITHIGVICHEFGHVLGAADYYDTDAADNGSYDGAGEWDLMSGGNWNNYGATPAHHNPYTKIYSYGWAPATTLTSGANITLKNAAQNSNSFYRVNTTTPNEFFLIENRQKIKFDSYIPGHGMIIYHVDENYIKIDGHTINVGSHQGMYPVCANATGIPPTSYGNINSDGLPFPGTGNKKSFTDATTPNALSWGSANTNRPIINITENTTDKTVSFNFMGGIPCTPPINQATTLTSSALTNNTMTIKWARGNGNAVLVVARAENAVNEDPANGTTYTANAAFGSGSQIGTGNYVVYNGTATSVNVSALTKGKAYCYAVYEYNSASNCYLTPALTGTALTTGVASYCAAGSPATTYEYISNVSIGSINKSSGRGTSGYQDYTSQIATMYIGVNTTATINVINPDINDQILIWVDWNKDGDFTDPGENVYTSTGLFASPHTTANFAPPVGAVIGKTRMRIRLNYTGDIGANSTPCGDSSYGEVEDYTIDVVLPNPPVAPTPKAATNLLQICFDANWNTSATVAGYRLDVATDIGFTTFVEGYNNKDVKNVTSCNITGLSAHTQYYFRVRAYNVGGTSSSSVVVPATTLTNPPAAPIALTASSCNNLVTLKWRKNTDPYFIRYLIYGGPSSNSIIKIDASSDAISDTTKIISGLTNGQSYYFSVTAVNFDGPESTFSNQSSAKVKTGVIPKIKSKWGDLLICYNLGDSITSYQWFNGSALIPNAISQYYSTNKVASTYKVETIDINGCKNTSNTALTSGTKSLILYPNPASVSFSIKLKDVPGSNDNSEQEALVSIINSTGAKVLEFQAKNINDELLKAISVGHLSNGTYIVQVLLNQKDLYYSKIVVIK